MPTSFPASGSLSLEELRDAVTDGAVDTIYLAFSDMQGRLQGKRCAPEYFLNTVVEDGSGVCNYLLSVNVEMEPQTGYRSNWSSGFGDYLLAPDVSTLRWVGWEQSTVICLADVKESDGAPTNIAPRAILQHQIERLAQRGWTANVATELEFIVHKQSYAEAWDRNYQCLEPINRYNVDYSLAGLSEADPLINQICASMMRTGLVLETAKGEANYGQHEINFEYSEPLTTADQHVLFKAGVKDLARRNGVAATFMAKWNEREGSSCHLHLSLSDENGNPVFASSPDVFDQFLAGQLATLRDFTMLYAPNVNSYKRYAGHLFAPTSVAWGQDNRSVALRTVGSGKSLRYENRLPGADVNPYIALAASIAAGLHGVDAGLELPPAETGDAYAAGHEQVPHTLEEARETFLASDVAVDSFGEEVVAHYARAAEIELEEFRAAVTDWERIRGYERL